MNTETLLALPHLSAPPHIRGKRSTPGMMLWVTGALIPIWGGSIFLFGWQGLLVPAIAAGSAVLTELALTVLFRKTSTINDLSALVCGLLTGLSLPPALPLWMPALASMFAVAVVKFPFGGLGRNFLNPALAGRAFLAISFPTAMNLFIAPRFGTLNGIDAETAATPLANFHSAVTTGRMQMLDLQDALPNLFTGNTGGCIGETSAILILLGACILLYGRIISLRIPSLFVGTVFLLFWIFNGTGEYFSTDAITVPVYQVLSGGLLLGAFYMATEPVTTPITPWGKVIFGISCGILTFLLRTYGPYAEGTGFAILTMNCFTPLIDRLSRPRPCGEKVSG